MSLKVNSMASTDRLARKVFTLVMAGAILFMLAVLLVNG